MPNKKLFERILKIRAQATALYEFYVGQGVALEVVAEKIVPLSMRLNDLVTDSANTNVSGCAEAVKVMDNLIAAYEKDIAFFINKIFDMRDQQDKIKRALIGRMKAEKVDCLEESGFIICLVNKDGKDDIVVS